MEWVDKEITCFVLSALASHTFKIKASKYASVVRKNGNEAHIDNEFIEREMVEGKETHISVL